MHTQTHLSEQQCEILVDIFNGICLNHKSVSKEISWHILFGQVFYAMGGTFLVYALCMHAHVCIFLNIFFSLFFLTSFF